jgi:hypothetical protein
VEIPDKAKPEFEALMKGKTVAEVGKVTNVTRLAIRGLNGEKRINVSLPDLRRSWKTTLSSGVGGK